MFKQILVAVDGTPTSTRALGVAIGLAKEQQATLHILHVVDETVIPPDLESSLLLSHDYMKGVLAQLGEIGSKILARAEKSAKAKGATTKAMLITHSWGGIATAILAHARKVRADLIVLGTHGRRGIARIVMGSDAESVLREAAVPVLLVRPPAKSKTVRKDVSPAHRTKQRAAQKVRVSVVRPAS